MNAAIQTIEMKVDSQALINNLKLAFTSKTTFISELLQNGRRAGATEIHINYEVEDDILTVSDNGHGIKDLQDLLSVAHSGWDEDIKGLETPYGMGFLSALFAATHVEVASCGKIVAFDTQDAMSFQSIPVHDCDFNDGTLVIMKGALHNLKSGLSQAVIPVNYTYGFPIPVFFNGEELPREHAVDQKSFIQTDVGLMHIKNLASGGDPSAHFTYYLQGQNVSGTRYSLSGNANIVHLDPVQFKGRLPDRDCLIEEDQSSAAQRCEAILKQHWRAHFEALKKEVSPDYFASTCLASLKDVDAIDLLDDVDFVPPETLLDVSDYYPVHSWEWEEEGEKPGHPFSRAQIESGEVKVVRIDDCKEIDRGMQDYSFVYLAENVFIYNNQLTDNHWLEGYVIDLKHEDISVRLNGVQKVTHVQGTDHYYSSAVFCDSIELHHPVIGSVVTDCDALYITALPESVDGLSDEQVLKLQHPSYWNGKKVSELGFVAVPKDESEGSVVRQCHSFQSEFDALEDFAEEEDRAFCRFLMANRPGSEAASIRAALSRAGIDSMESLRGKRFEVEINDDSESPNIGEITVVMI